jgi:membrane dipeptidase
VTARDALGVALGVLVLARLPVAGAELAERPPAVVDLHVDLSYRVSYGSGTLASGSGQYPAAALLRAGVAGVVLPLFVPKRVSPVGPRAEDLEASFTRLLALIPSVPPYAPPGCTAPPGTVRTWLSFEGAAPLAEDPDAVKRWVARGARLFGLVHTSDNALATSSGAPTESRVGLTAAGRDMVHRIHAAGGVVDVSHASDAATAEILRLAAEDGVPVVASHSNVRAVTSHPRNLPDALLRGIAKSGGVVGVNLHSRFLTDHGSASIADVVRHVRHLVRVAGAAHVAIGSDFEGDIRPPRDLPDVSAFPRLAAALTRAGFSRSDTEAIFGGNALRILCPADAPSLKK